jgi:hypothetical protein
LDPLSHGNIHEILQILRKELIILVDAVVELYAQLKNEDSFLNKQNGRTLVYEKPVQKNAPERDVVALKQARLLLDMTGITKKRRLRVQNHPKVLKMKEEKRKRNES